jgi:chemotaxis protein MotB
MKEERSSGMPMAGFLAALVLIYALVIGALYYFVYTPQQDALDTARRELASARREVAAAQSQASELTQESDALRAQVSDLESVLLELRQTSAELAAQIRERESELAAARATQDELVGVMQEEIANGEIQVQRLRDSLRVDLVNEILFDSGETTIKAEGLEVLRRVGEVLNRAIDKQIVVQGHTDNVAISGRLAQRYPTNWELSSARAVNVTRFLQDEVGVDPKRLSAAGFSEHRPRAANDTTEGRQMNRRIEILLAPLPEPFPVASPVD